MMETTISNFHTSFYIPEIHNLTFVITHVQILVTDHCGDSCRTAFKHHESFQDVLCRSDYYEGLVVSFSHQIQSEYYGRIRSVSVEFISLEISNALLQTEINSPPKHVHTMQFFVLFLSDDSKQDAATTSVHSKLLIELLKEKH